MLDAWQQATENIEKVMSEGDFGTWIQPVHYSHHDGNDVFLTVPNSFIKEWLEEHYLKVLTGALSATSGYTVSVNFVVRGDEEHQLYISEDFIAKELEPSASKSTPFEHVFTPLNPKYTFDQFVSGSGNQFAHAAATAVANNPADTYNPLFIYGGVGLGKSHLLNSIGHTIREQNPELNVCYCSAEKFMYEMVNHIRLKKMDVFRNRFRNIDVLLVDDIQFISGNKVATQEEFFHTFNALYDAHKQIVITSDKFPREIPDLEERLRSRFEWGLIADIQPPDVETKMAILKKKSEYTKVVFPEDVYYFLASSDTRNIRELEGMLIRLGAFSSLQNIPVTLEMAKDKLRDILGDRHKEITVELIQKTVADFFDLKVVDLKSEKRLKNIVMGRQVAIWLCRDMTKASYPDIGSKFGGKDHSTVIHSFKKIDKAITDDPKLSKVIDEIKRQLLK
ncbi:MAG TPA: chromosomal replication initiator protein DnaA [Desulfuromonadales bacterium]|nr:chromosomal replication initiator protein DnaA [Desulfuromonadales bacterium]